MPISLYLLFMQCNEMKLSTVKLEVQVCRYKYTTYQYIRLFHDIHLQKNTTYQTTQFYTCGYPAQVDVDP